MTNTTETTLSSPANNTGPFGNVPGTSIGIDLVVGFGVLAFFLVTFSIYYCYLQYRIKHVSSYEARQRERERVNY
jgi:hypothetical protein